MKSNYSRSFDEWKHQSIVFIRSNEQKLLANRKRRTEVPAHLVKQVFTILWIIYRANHEYRVRTQIEK